jgi:hypothetical protein
MARKKLVLPKILIQETEKIAFFCPRLALERNSESLIDFFSAERNSEHFSPLWNTSERNSVSFLFRGMIHNKIPRVCFYLCSMVQNSEHFPPLRNGSERNSESFLLRGTAGIPPEQTNCSVYSVFREIIFLSEIANPILYTFLKLDNLN